MEIRAYGVGDREGCLAVIDSIGNGVNRLRAAFVEYLESEGRPFFVAEHEGEIVGCGGYSVAGEEARLHWLMVGRQWQRQGLGRFLLFYCMKEISKAGAPQRVGVAVPREAAGFYVGQGFREAGESGNRVELVKRLAVCG